MSQFSKVEQHTVEKMSFVKETSYSVNSFSMKLHSQLTEDKPRENLFYSPTSICIALAMTYAGAKGNTAREVEQVMNWTSPETVHEMMKALQGSLLPSSGTTGIELNLANRLWAQKGFPILKEFTKILKSCYKAKMGTEDFKGKTEEARRAINLWVEEKTNSKIKDLLKEGVLNSDTRLVLTNAVYFKGSWQDPFDKTNTYDWDFKVSETETSKVKLMNNTDLFMYAKNESLSCQVLKLPYKHQKMAMMILLPDKADGLAKLEEKVNADQLRECNEIMRNREVIVSLPKFKIDCQFNLENVLQQLGIHELFGENADLSGITGNKDLFVSAVVHQAFVDVNEEGTEAAAASTAEVLYGCAMGEEEQPPHFLADHPFLFVIQHCESGVIVFVGRIIKPKSK